MASKEEAHADDGDCLDLTRKCLKKLEKLPSGPGAFTTLIVDDNELQRLENLDTYGTLLKLSAANNNLIRMLGVARLHQLQVLNLPRNNINSIEGLKDLVHLTWLNLSDNNIKNVSYLMTNVKLEYLDLSQNAIGHISDISHLKVLKKLMLHGNKISTLKFCNIYLPANLATLTLSYNELSDLTEMYYLSHLTQLEQFSIANNPAVIMTGQSIGFDYRPYVINWCLSLRMLDGFLVGPKDSLKAEWLYSQGKGRHFRPGEHDSLIQYLAGVCPLCGNEDPQSEEDEKLMRILSKAKEHQMQLREQEMARQGDKEKPQEEKQKVNLSSAKPLEAKLSPMLRRQIMRRKTMPSRAVITSGSLSSRSTSSCDTSASIHSGAYNVELPVTLYGDGLVSSAPSSADMNMTRSMDADSLSLSTRTAEEGESEEDSEASRTLMSQSLDPELLREAVEEEGAGGKVNGAVSRPMLFQQVKVPGVKRKPEDLIVQEVNDVEGGSTCLPLESATKFVPIPEAMMSPDFCPVAARSSRFSATANADSTASSTATTATSTSSVLPSELADSQPQQNGVPKCRSVMGGVKGMRNEVMFGGFMAATRSPLASRKKSTEQSVNAAAVAAAEIPRLGSTCGGSSRTCGTRICGKPIVAVETRRVAASPRRSGLEVLSKSSLSGGTPSASPLPIRKKASVVSANSSKIEFRDSLENGDMIGDALLSAKLESIRRIAQERKQTLESKVAAKGEESGEKDGEKEACAPRGLGVEILGKEGKEGGGKAIVEEKEEKVEDEEKSQVVKTRAASAPAKLQTPADTVVSKSSLSDTEAAVRIQKTWKGYHTRNLNPRVVKILEDIRYSRAEKYIRHLMKELEHIKAELDNERKLRKLQMEAIKAIWREKLSDGQQNQQPSQTPSTSQDKVQTSPKKEVKIAETAVVSELSKTCAVLQTQVQQLQDSFEHIIKYMSTFTQAQNLLEAKKVQAVDSSETKRKTEQDWARCTAAIQTTITAVQTPKDEHFPFRHAAACISEPVTVETLQVRPSTLALSCKSKGADGEEAPEEVKRYVTEMVEEILAGVTSGKAGDAVEEVETED